MRLHRGKYRSAELAGTDVAATEQVRKLFDRTEAAFQVVIEEGQLSEEINTVMGARSIASLLLNTKVGLQLFAKPLKGPTA